MAKRKYVSHYTARCKAVDTLQGLGKEHITTKDFANVAKELKVPYGAVKLGWETFSESAGTMVDRRCTADGKGIKLTLKPSVVATAHFNKNTTISEACAIIYEYMATDINSRELCNKHNISIAQFYGWIHDLNVSGRIVASDGNKLILNWNKYGKVEVKDVIWLRKKPETSRKSILCLSQLELTAYNRVADVLEMYLCKYAGISRNTSAPVASR